MPAKSFVTIGMVKSRRSAAKLLAGWLESLAGGWKMLGLDGKGSQVNRQMRVIETLTIGPKKHLVLVTCGGERFLVGTGSDSVQTIVPLGPEFGKMTAKGASECV